MGGRASDPGLSVCPSLSVTVSANTSVPVMNPNWTALVSQPMSAVARGSTASVTTAARPSAYHLADGLLALYEERPDFVRPESRRNEVLRAMLDSEVITREQYDMGALRPDPPAGTLLRLIGAGYRREGKRYLTLAIGCTGGKHRSVALSEELSARLASEDGMAVKVVHRDLGRE